jgi:multicomponent Na+:H+ antiporter subunit D
VLIGFGAGPVMDYAIAAAGQLAEPVGYLQRMAHAGGQ